MIGESHGKREILNVAGRLKVKDLGSGVCGLSVYPLRQGERDTTRSLQLPRVGGVHWPPPQLPGGVGGSYTFANSL